MKKTRQNEKLLDLEDLPGLQRRKPFARDLRFIQRLAERDHRRVDGFVGELEGAVMMRQC